MPILFNSNFLRRFYYFCLIYTLIIILSRCKFVTIEIKIDVNQLLQLFWDFFGKSLFNCCSFLGNLLAIAWGFNLIRQAVARGFNLIRRAVF